jgi:D-2-hydroxyacid dehydrogenase (NADP+)
MENVIATPHSAGFSSGNEAKVDRLFLDNLGHWLAGRPLINLSGDSA